MADTNSRKKMIFYMIFAVSVLIMVVVGATYAFFEAMVSSDPNSVGLETLEVSLLLEDDNSYVKSNIVPASSEIVDWAFFRDSENKCIDTDGREVCSVYSFTVINPSFQSPIPITMTLNPLPENSEFHNLYFKIYRVVKDSNDIKQYAEAMPATKIVYQDYSPISLSQLDTFIPASTSTTRGEVNYEIVMWLHDIDDDQTELDSGKAFKATLNVVSGYDGVKGIQASFLFDGDENANASTETLE